MPTYSVSTVTATLVASTAYTAIEIKPPSACGIIVEKWWVELTGASSDKPVLVQMGLFSAAVTTLTAIAAANVPKVDYGMNSLNAQSTVGVNATAEGAGTFTANAEQHYFQPNAGATYWESSGQPLGNTAWTFLPSATSVRLRLTPGTTITSAVAACGMTWYEG